MQTNQLEVNLYKDEELQKRIGSVYDDGAVLIADGYCERPKAQSYALHVTVATENGLVDGYISLKRVRSKPLDAQTCMERFAQSGWDVDGLPIGEVEYRINSYYIEEATPTPEPTATPTAEPTATPTTEPTATPTAEPTATPTAEPTATPTAEPTATPTAEPTATPTAEPTATPTPEPTATPMAEPTATPTAEPTATPTAATSDEAEREDETDVATSDEAEREDETDVATSDEAEREDEVSVTVIVDIPEDGLVPEGATISFVAMIQGAEPADLMFQWQFSRDGESWEDIDGANGQSYDVAMTAANADCYWRVTVSRLHTAQEEEA